MTMRDTQMMHTKPFIPPSRSVQRMGRVHVRRSPSGPPPGPPSAETRVAHTCKPLNATCPVGPTDLITPESRVDVLKRWPGDVTQSGPECQGSESRSSGKLGTPVCRTRVAMLWTQQRHRQSSSSSKQRTPPKKTWKRRYDRYQCQQHLLQFVFAAMRLVACLQDRAAKESAAKLEAETKAADQRMKVRGLRWVAQWLSSSRAFEGPVHE